MEHFELIHHFEVLIGREDVENPKPHAEPIDRAMQKMGVSKEQCWIIGDTRLDIGSANNAGIKSVKLSHLALAQQPNGPGWVRCHLDGHAHLPTLQG